MRNCAGSNFIHPVHNRRIQAESGHDEKPLIVRHGAVERHCFSGGDNVGQVGSVARNLQILGQKVFGPQRQNGDRQTRQPVRHVAHCAIPTSGDDGDRWLRRSMNKLIQLVSVRKHPDMKSVRLEPAD